MVIKYSNANDNHALLWCFSLLSLTVVIFNIQQTYKFKTMRSTRPQELTLKRGTDFKFSMDID